MYLTTLPLYSPRVPVPFVAATVMLNGNVARPEHGSVPAAAHASAETQVETLPRELLESPAHMTPDGEASSSKYHCGLSVGSCTGAMNTSRTSLWNRGGGGGSFGFRL